MCDGKAKLKSSCSGSGRGCLVVGVGECGSGGVRWRSNPCRERRCAGWRQGWPLIKDA